MKLYKSVQLFIACEMGSNICFEGIIMSNLMKFVTFLLLLCLGNMKEGLIYLCLGLLTEKLF